MVVYYIAAALSPAYFVILSLDKLEPFSVPPRPRKAWGDLVRIFKESVSPSGSTTRHRLASVRGWAGRSGCGSAMRGYGLALALGSW